MCCDGVRLACVAPWAVKAEGEKWAKLSMSDEPLLLRSSELLSPFIFAVLELVFCIVPLAPSVTVALPTFR